MPSIEHFASSLRAKVPPLSAAAKVGNLLFVSGTPGFYEDGTMDEEFAGQFDQTMVNLNAVLAQAGTSVRSIVKANVLLTRAQDVAEMNVRYAKVFGPAPYPARTTAIVAALPDPRMLIEIECVVLLSTDAL